MAESPTPEGRKGVFRATLAASLGALVIGGLGVMAVTASDASAESNNNEKKVTLCHATGSETNPYESITVSVNALKGGHGEHENDIIPPTGDFGGMNWPAGAEIWDNGCVKPNPTETKTETATATATETATSTETATAMSTVTATATVTAPAGGVAAESTSPSAAATGEAAQSPSANEGASSATAASGGEAATSPKSANAGGGAGSGSGTPMWALGLLIAGVVGTALSSIGLARKR